MRGLFEACVAAAMLLCPVGAVAAGRDEEPDMILRNGRIFTGDARHPWAEAIAIRGDRVTDVGTNLEITGRARGGTRIIDLGGRMAMPGINDAHDHVGDVAFGTPARTSRPPMADPTLDEVAAAVAAAAKIAPSRGWIHAVAGPSVMADAKATRDRTDAAAGGRPVAVTAWWGHGVIFNRAGMERLNIREDVRDLPGGHYERDTSGRLTGKLEEYAGWAALMRLHSSAGKQASLAHLRDYAQRRLAEGVTSVQLMAGYQTPAIFTAALKEAGMPLRTRVIRFPMPGTKDNGMRAWSGIAQQISTFVRVSGVKWLLDGTPIDMLAFSTTAYRGRPGWFGRPNFSEAQLTTILKTALRHREPLALHIVGDQMTEVVLTAMEKLAAPERWTPLRVRFEHANGLAGPRLQRARRLGIVIAQPRPTSPIGAWNAAGVRVAYGSDVAFSPFLAFAQMTASDNPNALARTEALAILTRNGAYAEFAEKQKGVLAPGMLADIAVLSQDVTTAPSKDLARTRSLLTIVGGRPAFAAPEYAYAMAPTQ